MKFIRFFVFPAVLMALAWPGRAQVTASSTFHNRATDSLRAVLRRVDLADSQRVLALFSLEQEYYLNDNATALRIGRQALELARQQGFVRGEMMLLSDLARTASNLEDLPQAERWAQLLQRRAATAPAPLRRFRIVALQTLASVAMEQHDVPRTIGYLRQAVALLPLVANRPDSDLPLLTYYGLGEAYASQVLDVPHPADSLVRQARYYTARFAALAAAQGRPDVLLNAYNTLGQLNDIMGGDSATYYLQKAVRLARQQGMRYQESYVRNVWAQVEYRHHRYPAAIALAQQALALALAVQDPVGEYQARDVLAQALAATGRATEAYGQSRRARRVHDSTEQVSNRTELQTLQVRFDTAQKEGQITALTQQQAQQRQRLLVLAAGVVVLLLALTGATVLALRLRRSRAQLAAQHEELARTRATQDRLYALVAHDLRAPVLAFNGLADLVQHYVQRQDATGLAGLGGLIRQTAHNLSELLDTLLNWALSQRGELAPAPRPLGATELLVEMAALYQTMANNADITLGVEAPPDLLVQADLDMTRTILRNLLGNALKVTPAGGVVTLRASRDTDKQICLQVFDTSSGLSPDTLAQLMGATPKMRVAGQGRGAGLGIPLSRAFAEAQGGHLALANRAGGTGTVATLTLPAAPA